MDEPNETVKLRLSSAVNADFSGGGNTLDGTGTITDDDATSVVLARAGSGGIAEDGGTEDVTITLGRALVAGESVTVPLTVTGATETTHYTFGLKGNGGTGVSLDTTTPNNAQNPSVTLSGAGARTATLALTAVANTDRLSRTVAISYGTSTRAPSSTGLAGGISATGSVSVPILDDDAMVGVTAASVAEGGNMDFTVTLPDPAPTGGVTVGYSTSNGRGNASDATHQIATGADYTAASEGATITIAANGRSGTIRIATTDDSTYEGDHYFTLTLTSTSHFNLSTTAGSATGTITDAADTPSFVFSAASTTADEGDGTVALTVQKSGTTLVDATVSYQTAGGTATGGSDFTAIASTDLVFKASESSKSFNVSLTNDSADEPAEAFTVSLTAGADAKLGSPSRQTVNITDDDATTVTLEAPSTAIDENSGAKTLTVELGRVLTGDETLSVPLTFEGSAAFGADYTLAAPNTTPTGVTYSNLASIDLVAYPPTVSFSGVDSAASSATLTLTAKADATDEGETESVTVGLGTLNASSGTNLGGGASGSGTASFNITDDDDAPDGITLTLDTVSMAENDATATVKVTATVTGGTAYATDTTVSVKVGVDGDSAVEGTDYADVDDFELTINAMETSAEKTFSLNPTDDTLDEDNETINVTGMADGVTVTPANIALTDDDDPPKLSINSPSIAESDSGETATLRFTVSLDVASGKQVTVAYAELSGGTAVSGTDYAALTPGTLTFAAGDRSKTIDVTVNGDVTDEDNETLKLRLSTPTNAGFVGSATTIDATGTITDDDDPPVLSINAPSVTEGNKDTTTTLSFTVTLTPASSKQVTVAYAGQSGGTATSGSDYTALTSGTLTFAAGDTSKTIDVTINGDVVDEPNETLKVRLSSPTYATLTGDVTTLDATGTITDDDGPPTGIALKVDKASVAENAGSTAIRITAEVTGGTAYPDAKTVQVNVGAGTDSAVEGTDYTTVGRLDLTIAASAMSQTYDFNLVPSNDDLDEDNERISITGTATSFTVTSTIITLTDDDTRGVLVSPVTITLDEADDGATPAEEHKGTYTVELDSEPTDDVSVNISVPADAPFTVSATQLDFTPSNWSDAQTVTVTATDDVLDNTGGNRSATITHALSAADTDYEDETVASVVVTVNDDDAAPMNATLTVDADAGTLGDQDSIGEGTGQTAAEVTVSIDDATRFDTAQTVSVTVGKNGDGAVEGTDYGNVARFDLTIDAGAASGSKSFNLTPTDDDFDEGDESLSVEGTLAGLTIAADSLTITDNDTAALVLAPTSLTVIEGANGTFTVKLATQPTGEVAVTVSGFTSTDLTIDDTSLTFTTSNWNRAQTVTVSAGQDADKTGDLATLTLSASGGGYASISASLPVTTSDDEAVVTVGAASAAEGSSVGFTVTLPEAAPAGGVTVDYSTSDGRGESTDAGYQVATAGSDYTAADNDSITIAQGQSSGTISIATTDDNSYEGDHHFTLTLDAAAGFDISPSAGSAIGTITDAADMPSYAFSAAATTLDEDEGTATLRVQRTGDTEVPATLSYATANGTATGGSDFTAIASTNLAFTAAETNKTFTVAITDDSDDEPAEAFSVNLSAISHAKTGSQASHTVNITDDDATTATLAAPAGDIAEKNGGKTITVTLGRTLEGDEALAVPLTFGGAAAFGGDYTLAEPNTVPTGVSYENLASTNLTTNPPTIRFTGISSAARAATLTLTAVNDVIDENGAEPVTVGLGALNASSGTNLGGGASGTGSASFNISDDDSAPGGISLSVDTDSSTSGSQTNLAENAGKTSVTVTASVTGGTAYQDAKTVEITVGTSDDDADEGEDYATVEELTLTIPAGATTRELSFDLTPTDDDVDENDEIIRIEGESGDIPISNASITLNDNDTKGVSVSSNSLTIEEVDDGSTPGTEEHKATYTVGLDSQPTGNVRVTLNLPNGAPFTASPTQLDFTSSSWGAQTVAVTAVNDNNSNAGGKRSATITHTLTASGTDYDSETVGSVAVTVNDDDDAPMSATLSVDADTGTDGTQTDLAEGGGAKTVRVTASFGGSTRFDTAQTIAVTVGANTDSATRDTDYSSVVTVNVTIAAGAPGGYKDFTLTPTDDDVDEADESISLVGVLSGVTVSSVSIGLTDDDERGATLSGTSLTVNEVDTAATTDTRENEATYTLALDSQPTAQVRVNLSLPNGAPVTISPTHLDFTTSNWGAQTVTVTAVDDDIDNPNDRRETTITHTLVAGSSDYGTVTVPNVSVRVNDNDAAPGGFALSADISSIAENAATRNVTVTASVGGGTTYSEAKTVEVEVGGSGDNATEVADYAEVEKFSITINAGATTGQKSFSLNPTDDVIDEPNETIGITGTATGIDVDGASISIADNDAAPTGITLSVSPASVAEDAAATTVTVTATVTGGTTYATARTVRVEVGDGKDSAAEGTDYKSVDDFDLSIAAGAASAQKTFSLAPVDDDRDGADKRISVTGMATGISIEGTHIDLTDDEDPPTLSIDSPAIAEGADGTTARLRFSVRLDTASDKQVTVDYADRATGTADSATDYAALTAGTLTFAVGDTVKHIDLTVNGDDVDESNETVILRLSSPGNAVFAGTATTLDATGTITDDDTRGVSVSPTTLDIDEQDDASTASKKEHQGTFAVALTSEPTGGTVTINVASGATGTATVSPQSLTFNASNWETAQNVTVTAVDDVYDNTDDARKAIITNTVSASGTDYSGETASNVTVTVDDDDTAPMDVALSVDTTTLAEDAGATSITVTATLKGDARFAADKTVRITVGGDADAAVSGTDYKGVEAFDITITASQASGEQSFTLKPTDDVIDEPTENLSVTGKLAGLTVAPASISITDNDAAPTGIALSVNTDSVSESAAATSVTVTADVQGGTTYGEVTAVSVIVGATADSASEGADYTRVDVFTIDIPVGAASASESFDLAPVNDIIDEPTERLSVSGKSGDLTVTGTGTIDITDDDATPSASLVLSKTTINEDGGSAKLGATISGPSSQALTLAVAVDLVAPMTTNDFTITANPELIIPAGETSSSAKIAVTAVDNDEDHAVDDKQLHLSATASGGLGIANPDEVTLTIRDDDKAGVNFSASEIEVEKDETTTIVVSLRSKPTMDTTVVLTSSNPKVAELSASPRGTSVELLFTPENWNVPRTVTVHGMEDGDVSIDTTIQSADPIYAAAPAPKPLRTNVIGVPNLTLTASEDYIGEGEAATFTIKADRLPTTDVSVKIEVGYGDCCIGTGEILAEGEKGARAVTLPRGQKSVSFKVQTADDDAVHGIGTRRGNKSINAQIVESDAYRIDHTPNDELARFTWYDSVRVGENDPVPPVPPADIIVSVSGPERVMEGKTATFTFTASKAPERDMNIDFYLGMGGDFTTTPAYVFDENVMAGLKSLDVTLPAGAVTTTFSIAIDDDGRTQGHGRMGVIVSSAYDNSYDRAERPDEEALVEIVDDETADFGILSVADAETREGPNAALVYVVSLEREDGNRRVRAFWRMHDGTARDGTDYRGSSGMIFFSPGETEKRIAVPVIDDAEAEGDETLQFELYNPEPGWVMRGKALGTILDDEQVGQAASQAAEASLRVEDARVTEAPGAELAFTVRLIGSSGERSDAVTVEYATEDGTATAGVDYAAVSGTLTFTPGQRQKTVRVPVHDDAHDEGEETMTLVLSSPEGAMLSRAEATGTIVNSDPMPAAWLARFGRAVAQQALDGIAGRIDAPRSPGFEGTVAGQALSPDSATQGQERTDDTIPASYADEDPPALAAQIADGGEASGAGSLSTTFREALLGSSFTATAEKDTRGGSLAVWGRGARSSFGGREGAISLDGEAITAMLGADYARDDWLLGMTLMQSGGKGSYSGAGMESAPQPCADPCSGGIGSSGKVEASLTAAVPYASLQVSERLALWGALGYGSGAVTLKPERGGSLRSGIAWSMAAAGLRGSLTAPLADGPGPSLAVTSDAMWTRTSSARTHELAPANSTVTRFRIGLEGSYRIALESGNWLESRLEAGLRHDGGDAETGFGIELGGGIAWKDPSLGLSLDLSGRALVAHDSDDLKDRGFAASLAWDPDPASRRGPSVSMSQDWGGQAEGGLDGLFAAEPLDVSGSVPESRWSAEGAYGFPAFSGNYTGSPQFGIGITGAGRDYSLGWQLEPEEGAPDIAFGVKATRQESHAAPAVHGAGIEATIRW